MICTLCLNRPCDDGDSLGSSQGLCQDCWEAASSAEWWEAVAALATSDDPLHRTVPDSEQGNST